MYPGWLLLGQGTPLDPLSNKADELINNPRALAYAKKFGLGWVQDCLDCETASESTLTETDYNGPRVDPAPWYRQFRPDTSAFMGVLGIDVTGADDLTIGATVTPSLAFGGTVGPRYHAPRTMVFRALAIARDNTGLQEGLRWLRNRVSGSTDPCIGERLTYFDVCPPMTCRLEHPEPCPCLDMTTPGGPCWPDAYLGLKGSPPCSPDWWPGTYQELIDGPPTAEEWCHWVYTYYELRIGADAWTCGAEACVVPYLRQFYNASVIEGPNVLNYRVLSNGAGAFAEIEFTVVAADPFEHGLTGHIAD